MKRNEPDSRKGAGIKKTISWLLMALMAALVGFSIVQLLVVASTASAHARWSQKAEQVQYRITAVIARGNRRIPASILRKSISIHPGDIYGAANIERDVAALKNTGYFDDLRAVTKDDAGTTDGKMVTFYVREKKDVILPSSR